MLPPDPRHQFDQPSQPDEVQQTQDYPRPSPTSPLLPATRQVYSRADDNTPLPLPYDDRDPTQQAMPAYQPTTPLAPYPGGAAHGQLYPPPQPAQLPQPYPPYQAAVPAPVPVPPPQIIYVRQRRPGLCSISCTILSILLLMTCGLVGLGIFRGVTSALDTAGKTIPARIALGFFCSDETTQNYDGAYQQLSSSLQQQMSQAAFAQASQQLDQRNGTVTSCSRSSTSPDTTSDNTVSIEVDVTRMVPGSPDPGKVTQGNIVLQLQGSDWRINHIDASLNLV